MDVSNNEYTDSFSMYRPTPNDTTHKKLFTSVMFAMRKTGDKNDPYFNKSKTKELVTDFESATKLLRLGYDCICDALDKDRNMFLVNALFYKLLLESSPRSEPELQELIVTKELVRHMMNCDADAIYSLLRFLCSATVALELAPVADWLNTSI